MEVERHVTHRCTRQREHQTLTKMVTCDHQESPHTLNADDRFCVNPRHIPVLPIPCDECYSIESFWRRIPWEPDSTTQVEIEPYSALMRDSSRAAASEETRDYHATCTNHGDGSRAIRPPVSGEEGLKP